MLAGSFWVPGCHSSMDVSGLNMCKEMHELLLNKLVEVSTLHKQICNISYIAKLFGYVPVP